MNIVRQFRERLAQARGLRSEFSSQSADGKGAG
jgi:hypothetical protein